MVRATRITVVILELIRAEAVRSYLLDIPIKVNHNNFANRDFVAINHPSFCPIMLSMVVYWTTMAFTGNGELGFDSGEGA